MRQLFAEPFNIPVTNLPPQCRGRGSAETGGGALGNAVIQEGAIRRRDQAGRQAAHQEQGGRLRSSPAHGARQRHDECPNTASAHWKRWLGVEKRCLVPFTAFSEFNREAGGDIWFALDEDRSLAFFAGIWAPQWTSVRKVKSGEETIDVFAFLTTEPNAEVHLIHPKPMPVILTNPVDLELWMSSPWEIAKGLQRPHARWLAADRLARPEERSPL